MSKVRVLSSRQNRPVRLVGLGREIFILEITSSNLVRATIGSQAKIGKYPWNSEAFTNRIRPATSEPNRARGEIGKHLTPRMSRRESCWFESSRAHSIQDRLISIFFLFALYT